MGLTVTEASTLIGAINAVITEHEKGSAKFGEAWEGDTYRNSDANAMHTELVKYIISLEEVE